MDSEAGSTDLGTALNFLRVIWELNHAMQRASRSMQRRLGVTGPERLFIRVVGQNPGATPAEVANVLRVDRSSISPLIKKMVRRRLVSRKGNPRDARSFHLHLTATGRRIDSSQEGTIEQAVRETIGDSKSRDVRAASDIVVRIARRLSEHVDRAP